MNSVKKFPDQQRLRKAERFLFFLPLMVVALILLSSGVVRHIKESRVAFAQAQHAQARVEYEKTKARMEAEVLRQRMNVLKFKAELPAKEFDNATRIRVEEQIDNRLKNDHLLLLEIRRSTVERPCWQQQSSSIDCSNGNVM